MYKVVLESENWGLLNWLDKKINEESDYQAIARDYLNVGESMISKLEIFYFNNGNFACEFIRAICNYWGKDLSQVKMSLESEI